MRRYEVHDFPRSKAATKAPPIKTQGIKTKLIPFIFRSFRWDGEGRWIEPFGGSAVVAFNAAPKRALVADTNRHIIGFYEAVRVGQLTPASVREHLTREGNILRESGETHYYDVRKRFNETADPHDFLFLSRACFNGVMRFNKKGGFNVPFCRKPDRFRQALVTKIVNQVTWVSSVIRKGDWEFKVQDWRTTLSQATPADFMYVDPPYVGRHTDYYNQWSDDEAAALASALKASPAGFAYSMWYENKYRKNTHFDEHFEGFPLALQSHFYHVGSTEDLRNEMQEALVVSQRHAVTTEALSAVDHHLLSQPGSEPGPCSPSAPSPSRGGSRRERLPRLLFSTVRQDDNVAAFHPPTRRRRILL